MFDEDKSGAGIELYGTRGTAPYNHEGHAGWSSYDILNNVKSIVTLILTAVFAVLSVNGKVSAKQFQTVFTIVISLYFGTQYQKNSENKGD